MWDRLRTKESPTSTTWHAGPCRYLRGSPKAQSDAVLFPIVLQPVTRSTVFLAIFPGAAIGREKPVLSHQWRKRRRQDRDDQVLPQSSSPRPW